MLAADFQNSFTVVYSKKFATKLMQRCPSHIRYVAALHSCNGWGATGEYRLKSVFPLQQGQFDPKFQVQVVAA